MLNKLNVAGSRKKVSMSFYNADYGCFHSLVNVHQAFKGRSFMKDFMYNFL